MNGAPGMNQAAKDALATHFTGAVRIDIVETPGASRLRALTVHFPPCARTAWHSHPHGQLIHVTTGVALVQRRGGPITSVGAGESVWTPPGIVHWHGAPKDQPMAHLVVLEADDTGAFADWGDYVTDEEHAGEVS